ncbi:rab11 family-interacting protein 2 isoform X4 [Prionailurus iriomotensis]
MSLAASAGRGPGAVWSPTHVQVTVLQARGLRAKGPGGTSDAYAVIQVGKEKYATSVSERSLGAPVWREEATFELPPLLSAGAAPAAAATLQLTVLHRALLGLDKFLGRAEVDLRELHRDQGRRKTQWYTLKSKPGKKDKERGEIEVDIQFMRNNMTASMFDLSMKDKSRNPFGKLKDKIKGKHKDSASDTASAVIPSVAPSADSDDESTSKDKKKKSKIKTLFSKSNLQKTPLSQSMSVLPTSKSDKVLLRPGGFQSRWEDDENEDESSSASDVLSPKRTESAHPKQLNQINFNLPKKEGGLPFLGGLRSKNDFLSRSNVCINGNHVYVEQPEAKSETKDSTPSSSPSPQGFRKKHLFSSTENLATRSWKEPGDVGAVSSDRQFSESSTKDSLKSMSLPSYRPQISGDIQENTAPVSLEAAKETKENKKQENKKSSLLSLVTGKKDVAKGSEGGSPPMVPGKEKEGTLMEVTPRGDQAGPDGDLVERSEKDTTAVVSGRGKSLNPFEDVQITEPEADREPKSEPTPPAPSVRAPQTKAVKPRSAAPISTSTPVENWPSTDKGQAGPEEPSLLLKAEWQKESLTQVPKTVSCASGSLSKQLPTPVRKGPEDSPRKTSEVGPENTVSNDSAKSLLKQPETEPQEVLRLPPSEQASVPSSQGTQEMTFTLSSPSGEIESPAGKPPMGEDTDVTSPCGSCGENRVKDGRTASVVPEAVSPLQMAESSPTLGSVMQTHEESVHEGRKKIKKRVSFSEQLFTEEELEKSPGSEEEDEGNPKEPPREGATAGNGSDGEPAGSVHTEDSKREAASQGALASTADPLALPCEESFSEGPVSEASSGQDLPLCGVEGDHLLMAKNQSKASDHEGLLSDPLGGLPSAPGVSSPVLADLGLTLPSIPEVASDDERVDQVEDDGDGETARVAAPEAGPSSLSVSPARPEMGKGPSGQAVGWVAPTESLPDPQSKAPKASVTASSSDHSFPTTALGIHKPDCGKSSRSDKQRSAPGGGEKEELPGNGGPSQRPEAALDSPVPSPSFSETFPVPHSFPSYPHADTHHNSTAESQKKATAEGPAGKVDNSGKRKPLLQAWVSPSETHPVSAQPSTGTGSAKHSDQETKGLARMSGPLAVRLHPVKPMNAAAPKIVNSSLGTATIISENMINEAMMKKYNPSDPAFAYAQLTHDELIQLVLKQKETISKKEFQVRELEDYIDNLLVRVMEETPNILRIPAQVGKKAGKM